MNHRKAFAFRRRALGSAVSLAVLATALQTQAQVESSDEQEEPPTGKKRVDEEVIVIGQEFQNSLINRLPIDPEKLPFSIEIIDESMLYERGFFNPLDALETIPNAFRRNTQYLPTGGSYTIRGLYATALTNNRPENDSRGAGRRDSSQIERIEVLKGPVSILLGPIIPGGVINQVSKSPDESGNFTEIISRAGSFGTYRLEGDTNIARLFGSDVVSARLTLALEDQGSPQSQSNTETFAVRPVVEANFSDRTRLQGSIAYSKREGVPSSSFATYSDGTIPDGIDDETFFGVPADHSGKDTYVDLELQHEFLDDLKLVVRGSYQDTDFDYQTSQSIYNYSGNYRGFEPDDTIGYVYYSVGYRDTDVAYADVQLVGDFDAFGQDHDWVVGVSTQDTKFASYWAYGGVLAEVDILDFDNAVYGEPDFDLDLLEPYRDIETELDSVYAEVNVNATDNFSILTGVRYDDHTETDMDSLEAIESSESTFRIGGTYAFDSGLNAYLSYAESFIPQFGTLRDGGQIEPETATNYEVGLKGSLMNGRLSLTAAIFALTRENVATPDPQNTPEDPPYVVPTGEQEHNGYELSASFELARGLHLDLAYGYVDTEVTESNNGDVGDPVSMIPENTFSLFTSYTFQDGALEDLKLGLGARGISERYSTGFDIEYDGYTLVDALIAYPINETFDVQLNIHNLTDEEYLDTAGFSTGSPGGGHKFGNPRSAYVTLRARF